jgi:hypothetical protein
LVDYAGVHSVHAPTSKRAKQQDGLSVLPGKVEVFALDADVESSFEDTSDSDFDLRGSGMQQRASVSEFASSARSHWRFKHEGVGHFLGPSALAEVMFAVLCTVDRLSLHNCFPTVEHYSAQQWGCEVGWDC